MVVFRCQFRKNGAVQNNHKSSCANKGLAARACVSTKNLIITISLAGNEILTKFQSLKAIYWEVAICPKFFLWLPVTYILTYNKTNRSNDAILENPLFIVIIKTFIENPEMLLQIIKTSMYWISWICFNPNQYFNQISSI